MPTSMFPPSSSDPRRADRLDELPRGGVTCITPSAPAVDTTCGWKPDSIHATARASSGSTPWRSAVRDQVAHAAGGAASGARIDTGHAASCRSGAAGPDRARSRARASAPTSGIAARSPSASPRPARGPARWTRCARPALPAGPSASGGRRSRPPRVPIAAGSGGRRPRSRPKQPSMTRPMPCRASRNWSTDTSQPTRPRRSVRRRRTAGRACRAPAGSTCPAMPSTGIRLERWNARIAPAVPCPEMPSIGPR